MADLNIATLSGDYTVISEAEVKDFRSSLHGETLLPDDAGYEGARRIWNAMINKRPAIIARCSGPADVVNSVNFASEKNLLISVRGGGHNFPGNSVCNDGLMIDLSQMTGVRVDPVAGTARAQGGTKWGAFDHETQGFGLATTGGTDVDTGIAGLTLGGGIGWLSGSHGLSCDNLISADVVTAEGRSLTASADENPDLLWALRGGGGNFGVVTSLEYQLHPVGPEVLAGWLIYPADKVKEFFPLVNDIYPQYARRNESHHVPAHTSGWRWKGLQHSALLPRRRRERRAGHPAAPGVGNANPGQRQAHAVHRSPEAGGGACGATELPEIPLRQ